MIAAVVFAGGVGTAIIAGAISTASAGRETCEAVDENNLILRELVVHVRNRSLASIKTGVTQDITAADVRAFYKPTIRRIDEVSC